ncbi:hypothetical protein DUI87_31920 [Hirundo rustica rustica]|uniref:Uncharacterized protein n=1 Tax=Hirundo rustica rustica TaxID=333673 RepID=A0A3M0IUX9_HIRRU|nr:hypothetical protein DUI87_31920 [Hirundo rustica rustica]
MWLQQLDQVTPETENSSSSYLQKPVAPSVKRGDDGGMDIAAIQALGTQKERKHSQEKRKGISEQREEKRHLSSSLTVCRTRPDPGGALSSSGRGTPGCGGAVTRCWVPVVVALWCHGVAGSVSLSLEMTLCVWPRMP